MRTYRIASLKAQEAHLRLPGYLATCKALALTWDEVLGEASFEESAIVKIHEFCSTPRSKMHSVHFSKAPPKGCSKPSTWVAIRERAMGHPIWAEEFSNYERLFTRGTLSKCAVAARKRDLIKRYTQWEEARRDSTTGQA